MAMGIIWAKDLNLQKKKSGKELEYRFRMYKTKLVIELPTSILSEIIARSCFE
jgi:hypothetical protein